VTAPGTGDAGPSLAVLVARLRSGKDLQPAEIRRLRTALTRRAGELGTAIGRAGGMDARTAKKKAAQLAGEVRRAGMAAAEETAPGA
jgi:hypothetical protein